MNVYTHSLFVIMNVYNHSLQGGYSITESKNLPTPITADICIVDEILV